VCRHRAFLFHHLAEALGLAVLTHRGSVPGGRHAWNELRIEGRRIFVDATLDLVFGDARRAEHARGYQASQALPVATQNKRDPSMMLVLGEIEPQCDDIHLDYELRKAPSGEEVVMLIYPERDLRDTRYLYSHVRTWSSRVDWRLPLFDMPAPITKRVYTINGDFADPLMDGAEPGMLGGLRG
jgi:hypothetical protein